MGRRDGGPGGVMGRCEALGHVTPDVRMRLLPAPGAWQGGAGTQWGNTIWVTVSRFGSSPHPSPGAYNGSRSHPPSLSLCSSSAGLPCPPLRLPACLAHFSTCLPRPLLHLSAPPSLHCPSSAITASTLGVVVRQTFFLTSVEHTFPRAPAK